MSPGLILKIPQAGALNTEHQNESAKVSLGLLLKIPEAGALNTEHQKRVRQGESRAHFENT